MKHLAGTLRAVEHQLRHGEASEGDVSDIAWCARYVAEVAEVLEEASRDSTASSSPVVHSDPNILGGTPVFVGTRVPARALFDWLEAGDPLKLFLTNFPSVDREQARAALALARDALLACSRTR